MGWKVDVYGMEGGRLWDEGGRLWDEGGRLWDEPQDAP